MLNTFCDEQEYQFPLTLEKHLNELGREDEDAKRWTVIWLQVKADFIEQLKSVAVVFQHYSLHDERHSKAITANIQLFLGEDRIKRLSVTDTFMMLCSFYAHDLCMSVSISEVKEALESEEFKEHISNYIQRPYDEYHIYAVILQNIDEHNVSADSLYEVYNAFIVLLEEFFRKKHANSAARLRTRLTHILGKYLSPRFINDLVLVANSHGRTAEDILSISASSIGLMHDAYHPRFIAAMLRLGDLLDLDNGRFGERFISAIQQGIDIDLGIPSTSIYHYQKHEAICDFDISPEHIVIRAYCGENVEFVSKTEKCINKCFEDSKTVAKLLTEWLNMLDAEVLFLKLHWAEIAGSNFGLPPNLEAKEIYLCGKPYYRNSQELKLNFSRERAFDLLKGANIYDSRFACIYEVIQNAIDASLIQLWKDATNNEMLDTTISPFEFDTALFNNYPIKVAIDIEKIDGQEKLYIEVTDCGTGIALNDIQYIARVGESKSNNKKIKSMIDSMPNWLKPSGIFGIGLQSVFELSNKIQIITKTECEPVKKIDFYAVSSEASGLIEVYELTNCNMQRGSKVKFYIDNPQVLYDEDDMEFDGNDNLVALKARLQRELKAQMNEFNYFDIIDVGSNQKLSKQYFETFNKNIFSESNCWHENNMVYAYVPEQRVGNDTINDPYGTGYIWDHMNNICYRLAFKDCFNDTGTIYEFADNNEVQISIQYKFKSMKQSEDFAKRYFGISRGFFDMDLQIFDYPPNAYVNIDRTFLSKQPIQPEQIELVLSGYFESLCKMFITEKNLTRFGLEYQERKEICNRLAKTTGRKAFSLDGIDAIKNQRDLLNLFEKLAKLPNNQKKIFKHNDIFIEQIINDLMMRNNQIFSDEITSIVHRINNIEKTNRYTPNFLVLAILFRYFVSNDIFVKFINKYKYFFEDKILEDDVDVTLLNLLKRTSDIYLSEMEFIDLPYPSIAEWLKLVPISTEPYPPEYRCVMASINEKYDLQIEPFHERKHYESVYALGISRVVMKPNVKYADIIVDKIPKSYEKSDVIFKNILEMEINTYILSPFEEVHYHQLNYKASSKDFSNMVMQGSLYKKCEDYVLKYHYKNKYIEMQADEEEKRSAIKSAYRRLIEDFYEGIMNSRNYIYTPNNTFDVTIDDDML